MILLKQSAKIIVGLFLGMTILAGEEPQINIKIVGKKPQSRTNPTSKQPQKTIKLVRKQSQTDPYSTETQPQSKPTSKQPQKTIKLVRKQSQTDPYSTETQPQSKPTSKQPQKTIKLVRKQSQTDPYSTETQPQSKPTSKQPQKTIKLVRKQSQTDPYSTKTQPQSKTNLTSKQPQTKTNPTSKKPQKTIKLVRKELQTNNNKKPAGILKSSILSDSYKRQIKLFPSKRTKEIKKILGKIPANAITQLLSLPKIINKEEITKSPYVVAFPGKNTTAVVGTQVYVRSILKPKTLDYSVYRKGQPYYNPETKELLGYETIYIASTRLQRAGDPATLMITQSTQEVRVGDRLLELSKDKLTFKTLPKIPKINIKGNIISVLEAIYEIGKYNIVVIDKGIVDGLKVGDILDIYQQGRVIADRVNGNSDEEMVQLPDELAGTLMVLSHFKRVSYALIMKATQVIQVLDKVKTPRYAYFE